MLSPREQTEITDEIINLVFSEENAIVAELAADGGFIGDQLLPGPKRYDFYWSVNPQTGKPLLSFNDMVNLSTIPNWEQLLKRSPDAVPAPESPYLLNLLREPGLFTEVQKDFISVNQKYQDRYEGGADEVLRP